MLLKKYFFTNKRKSILKKGISHEMVKKGHIKKNFHSLMSFYLREEKYFYNKTLRYSNILFSRRLRRKTFLYIQPFFVNRIFFSKLFGAKLLKRLSNIW